MENNTNTFFAEGNESIDIRSEIGKYVRHWKWFALSVIICVGVAVFYAKTQVNIFETHTSVLVKEDDGASSELQAFQDLSSLGFGSKNNAIDEIEMLKSRTLAESYVRKLGLNVAFFQQRGLKNIEVFKDNPISYQILSDEEAFYQLDTILDIKVLGEDKYEYLVEGLKEEKSANFGDKIKIGIHEFILKNKANSFKESDNNEFRMVLHDLPSTIESYQKKIEIKSIDDSNMITLDMKYPVREKAVLVLNTMIDLYNQMSVEDKNQVGEKTEIFIEERLQGIKKELDYVDRKEELYKKDKNITDIEEQGKLFIEKKSLNEQAIFQKTTQLSVVEFMIENIEKQGVSLDLLPSSIGAEDNVQLGLSVANYNSIIFERNRLLSSSSILNTDVITLNTELFKLRENIKNTLINSKQQLNIALNSLNNKEREYEGEISLMPEQVREYRVILRRQEIIAQLYSYLLEKKEENKISLAVTVPNAKVIDRAYSDRKPVGPRKMIIAMVGLILGIVIPFGVVYVNDLLDNKFHSKEELEKKTIVPVIGDIPFDKSQEKVVVNQASRSSSAEAFRLLRTNLDFMLSNVDTQTDGAKMIFVTSTVSGEGKTFVSVNTACSLALTGKKVLLVGMDLRAPKITQYLGVPNKAGVTNYLIGKEHDLSSLVFTIDNHQNLDILSSGIVPPNPAELLLNDRLGEMFSKLKLQYDYIVVDTAPVNLVTDTLMISKFSDMFIYVTRANYLEKRLLEIPQKLYENKRLPNMAILVNGLDEKRAYGYGGYGGYGNYGGYGYGDNQNSKNNFFKKIFKR